MKKRFNLKKIIVAALSAACLAAFGAGAAGCMPKSVPKTEPEDKNVWTDRAAPPADGSLPTAYSCAENLAFIVGKFSSQTQYHSYTDGVTSASIATQTTRNWKDYKDGVLVNSDITYSSMVKGGTQTCTVYGTDEEGNRQADTYFRTSATPGKDTTSTSAAWSQDAPTYFSENAYLFTYGFLPDEPFNYAVNADTIISAEEIKTEADGTYTLTFTLDPEGSTFYYQFGMKTRGGLSDYPDFQFIEMTVNFDADWQLNTCYVHEVSKINKGIVVTSTSDFSVVYSYGGEGFDDEHFSYYENYYKKYLGDDGLDKGGDGEDELVLDVAGVLSNGFANVLNGGQQFEISANLGGNSYAGYVYLALDLEDIAGSLNLKLSLGKELGRQDLYIEYADGDISAFYGKDFALKANLAAVKLQAEKLGGLIDDIVAVFSRGETEEGDPEDGGDAAASDPLTALMDSMTLNVGANQAALTLDTDDLLGLGVGIKAELVFGVNGNTVSFRGADIEGLSVGGEALDIGVGIKTTTAALISREPSETPADLADYVADVYSLLGSDLIKVTAYLNGSSDLVNISALKGLDVRVDAYADIDGIALGADAYVSYTYKGCALSAKLGVIYAYNAQTGKYGEAYLSLDELNGKAYGLKVRCDVEETVTAVSALLQTAGAEEGGATDGLVSILNNALSADLASLLTEMYADGTKIKISVSTDTVLDMLGIDPGVSFGSCELAYVRGGGAHGGSLTVALPAIGFGMDVCGADGSLSVPDGSDYLDLADLVGDISDLINAGTVEVGLTFDGSALGVEKLKDLTATATAYIDFSTGLAARVVADAEYGNITAKITADYIYDSDTYGLVVLTLNELCGVERSVKLYCNVNEVVDGVKTLLTYFGTEQSVEAEESGAIDLSGILANLLTADINALMPGLEAGANVLNLTLNADEVLKLFGVDLGMSVGNVSLGYTHGGVNLLVAEVPAVGISASVDPYNGNLPAVTTAGALNLADVLDDVNAILEAKKLAVGLTFDGSALGIEELKDLTATATAYIDFSTGLAARVVADAVYGNITAKITADYVYSENTYGLVVLTLNELCGVERSVKLYCNVNEVVDGVKTLLTYFGTSETAEVEENGAIDLSGIIANLLTADINALMPGLEAGANVLNLTLNADEVLKLFGVDLGMSVGNVSLGYTHGGVNLLVAEVPAVGISASVNPYDKKLPAVTTAGALNLADVLDDVNKILEAKKLAVGLTFDGSALGVEELKDLTATATAYIDFSTGLAASAAAEVAYKLADNSAVRAAFTIYYNYDKQTYGDVILSLDSFNGVATSVKVCCNVAEIKAAIETLIAYVMPQNANLAEEDADGGATAAAADVLGTLLTADFTGIINEISAGENVFNLSVNADKILKLFGIDAGITLGDVALKYTHPAEGGNSDMLYATVANFGVALGANPYDGEAVIPSADGCMDLTKLVNAVNGAIENINAIKDEGRIRFEIAEVESDGAPATYLYLDGIRVQVWGKGEISWKEGDKYVALDLAMSISEEGTDVTTLKFVYDGDGSPMAKLALNGVGIKIYKEDIESVKSGFATVYNKLADLLGLEPIETGSSAGAEQAEAVAAEGDTQNASSDRLITVILGLLARGDWVEALGDFTATCDGKSVALSYLADGNKANVTIGTNGGLSLAYNGAFGERFSLGGAAKVSAGGGSRLAVSFVGCDMASSKDGETEFIRLAYNFLFDCIRGISVENILGSSTYAVTFELDGANTDIAALKDVYVKAELYITDEASVNNGKIAEGLLNLDVAGVAVNLHVISEYDASGKAQFYINLTRVADILLPDLKMHATQDSLYETFKVLFKALTDTDIAQNIVGLVSGGQSAAGGEEASGAADGGSAAQISESTADKLASLLEKLINFNFADAVVAYEEAGVQYAEIDLDNLLSQLGAEIGGNPGNLSVEINHNNHSMTTSGVSKITNPDGTVNSAPWISLSSAKTEKRSYKEFRREDYLDIRFLPYLIDDFVKTATDANGKMYDAFTFSGTIEASIVSLFDITIDVRSLTLSLADNDFCFSAVMHVNKMSALGLVTIPESTAGISYHGGYLTLARGLDTAAPEYRIMTMDYFIDHMLVKKADDCVLQWWLNVSGWDTVISIVNSSVPDLDVSSGLTTAQDVYLYNKTKSGSTQLVSMYDYVDALKVVLGGEEYAAFGDMSELEKEFGISDNYYGFKLNAKKVTGDVLTKLYAAVTRNENGISGVKASGAIDSYVTFSAALNYEEGITEKYVIGNAAAEGTVAPSMYEAAIATVGGAENIDFAHFVKKPGQGYDEKFGCFSVYSDGNGGYETSYQYSNVLYSHTLTIVDLDGNSTTAEVRQGSKVHLYDNSSPVYTDDGKEFRLLYSATQGLPDGTWITMDGDMTVYAYRAKAVTVIMHAGGAEYTVNSFAGDKVPLSVEGLETVGEVTYADGTAVAEGDLVGDAATLHLYGTFVQSVVEIDGINYKFTYDGATGEGYYTVAGKADSFDHTVYTGGNAKTLVLQSEIGGYPVTAIGDNAFENTDGHALKNVIVPASITIVGRNAFLNNAGMESIVFLAPEVTMLGTGGTDNNKDTDQPFFGCSTESDANSSVLKIYYNTVIFNGSATDYTWTKLSVKSGTLGAINHRYYIGNKPSGENSYGHNGGGELISGGWDYVTARAEVSLDGVTGSTLTQSAVEDILSGNYPLVVTGTFTGDAEIEADIAVGLAQFDMTKNGITYKCVYDTEYGTVDGHTQVTYSVSYSAAVVIYVNSGVSFNYYGTNVAANKTTAVTVAVSGDSLELETPSLATHNFVRWDTAEENGVTVYNAVWSAKEFILKLRLTRGGTDTNIVHIDNSTYRINGNVTGGTADVTTLSLYGGETTFTVSDKVLTIVTGEVTYTIYVNEASVFGSDKGNKRGISSDVNGTMTVTGDITLTLSY